MPLNLLSLLTIIGGFLLGFFLIFKLIDILGGSKKNKEETPTTSTTRWPSRERDRMLLAKEERRRRKKQESYTRAMEKRDERLDKRA